MLDMRVVVGVLLLVSLFGTLAFAEDRIADRSYEWWIGLHYGEQMTYATGSIAVSYAMAAKVMGDNPGTGEVDLFSYAILRISNQELVELVNAVYRDRRLRTVPVAAIMINFRYWREYLGRY